MKFKVGDMVRVRKSNREVIDLSAELKKFQGEQVKISIERVR